MISNYEINASGGYFVKGYFLKCPVCRKRFVVEMSMDKQPNVVSMNLVCGKCGKNPANNSCIQCGYDIVLNKSINGVDWHSLPYVHCAYCVQLDSVKQLHPEIGQLIETWSFTVA